MFVFVYLTVDSTNFTNGYSRHKYGTKKNKKEPVAH